MAWCWAAIAMSCCGAGMAMPWGRNVCVLLCQSHCAPQGHWLAQSRAVGPCSLSEVSHMVPTLSSSLFPSPWQQLLQEGWGQWCQWGQVKIAPGLAQAPPAAPGPHGIDTCVTRVPGDTPWPQPSLYAQQHKCAHRSRGGLMPTCPVPVPSCPCSPMSIHLPCPCVPMSLSPVSPMLRFLMVLCSRLWCSHAPLSMCPSVSMPLGSHVRLSPCSPGRHIGVPMSCVPVSSPRPPCRVLVPILGGVTGDHRGAPAPLPSRLQPRGRCEDVCRSAPRQAQLCGSWPRNEPSVKQRRGGASERGQRFRRRGRTAPGNATEKHSVNNERCRARKHGF